MDPIPLHPHPITPCPAVTALTVAVTRSADLGLVYELRGDLARIALPPLAMPGFADELWRHTCFEVFIGRERDPGYWEYNFSPSGRWAAYAFADCRQRADLDPAALTPAMARSHTGEILRLEATVPLARLAGGADAVLRLGVSAVIETRDGTLSYWALRHPTDRPDFHHAEARPLRLEPPRPGC